MLDAAAVAIESILAAITITTVAPSDDSATPFSKSIENFSLG